MENEILQAIKHIKDISRKKVTLGKIEAFTKKNNIEVSTDELNNIIENMVTNGIIIKKGENKHASFSYPEQSEVSEEVADITEISQRKETKEDLEQGFEETQIISEEDTSQKSAVHQTMENKDTENVSVLKKEIDSLKLFQETVEKKLFDLEKIVVSQQRNSGDSTFYNNEPGDKNDGKSDFIFNLLKNRIISLENEISRKDAIIDHLTKQLFSSNNMSHANKKVFKTNEVNNDKDAPLYDKSSAQDNIKKKVVITGDSMLNGINERGLSKHQKVKVKNFSGGTGKKIVEELDALVADKPDCLIVHAGTNDITNGINSLNCAKKIIKKVKQISPNTKVVFLGLITRKDKKDLDKKAVEVNSRLKNLSAQKIDFMDNTNINEEHVGNKKLHLNKRGNTVLANNLLKYLRSAF